jgi:hypothetical protein
LVRKARQGLLVARGKLEADKEPQGQLGTDGQMRPAGEKVQKSSAKVQVVV